MVCFLLIFSHLFWSFDLLLLRSTKKLCAKDLKSQHTGFIGLYLLLTVFWWYIHTIYYVYFCYILLFLVSIYIRLFEYLCRFLRIYLYSGLIAKLQIETFIFFTTTSSVAPFLILKIRPNRLVPFKFKFSWQLAFIIVITCFYCSFIEIVILKINDARTKSHYIKISRKLPSIFVFVFVF